MAYKPNIIVPQNTVRVIAPYLTPSALAECLACVMQAIEDGTVESDTGEWYMMQNSVSDFRNSLIALVGEEECNRLTHEALKTF